jgi:DNA-binding FadR family transcriptional regulator
MRHRYEEVLRELGDAVVGATYPEGTWLPSVTELHQQLGCSRGVVREALRGLEERGLVEVHQGRGVKVRQRERWDTRNEHVLRSSIARGPEPEVAWLAIDARAAVECEAAVRAIDHASDADFGLLGTRVEVMEREAGSAFVAAEVWFHRTLTLLSANALLAKLAEPLHRVLAELRQERAPERDSASVRHHRRILEGISSRDPEMAREAIVTYADRLADWVGAPR